MSLITTVPGVQFTGSTTSGTFLINGVQSGAVDVRVNGADDNAEVFGGITIPPIPDAIQEMKVETGDNPAEVGHSYGTTVNVVTKSGTNKLVGSVWEYNENDMFNANDYFNKRNQLLHTPTPLPNRPGRLKSNSFGGIISGPVVIPHIYDGHNKTFFTFDMQDTDYTAVSAYTGTLPTGTMQSSGFTNLVDTLNQSTTKYTDVSSKPAPSSTRPLRAQFNADRPTQSPASCRCRAARPAQADSLQIPASMAARRLRWSVIPTSRNWASLRVAPASLERRTGFRRWRAARLRPPASITCLPAVSIPTLSLCSSCFRKLTTTSESILRPD
jgi:hypothetical protein